MAANCSGRIRSFLLEYESDSYLDTITASRYQDVLGKYRCQRDILDTFRVLVEQGQSDPMATDTYVCSALDLCTGSWDDFNYLVNQEKYHIDVTQLLDQGVSLAEYHARLGWPTSSRIANFAFEREKLLEAQYHRPQIPGTPPKSSKISILHGAVGFMRQHYNDTQSSVRYAISLVRQLILSGIDLHEVVDQKPWIFECTVIDVIVEMLPVYALHDPERVKQVTKAKAVPCFKLWLNILKDADIDVKKYLYEEGRLALSKKERDVWSPSWDSYEGRADWHVLLNEDEQNYSISIYYVYREKAIPIVDSRIPGGWVEDS